jgi:flavodoxin I
MNNAAANPVSRSPSVRRRMLHVVFATTSGHTEFVVDKLVESLAGRITGWVIEESLAEQTQPQDLLRGDVLLLASATWNTGGIEGQLNPHMSALLLDRAKNLDLASKPCACIGLGDHRYFYIARALEHLQRYIESHHGRLILPALKIVDEPYGQEDAVRAWGEQFVGALTQIAA